MTRTDTPPTIPETRLMLRRLASAALLSLVFAPDAARAQLGFSVACAPGIPGCAALRFTFANAAPDLALNTLGLRFVTPGWTFTSGPSATVGLYSATDSFGAFSGFSTVGSAGRAADLDFTDNGFPFTVVMGGIGFLDLAASGGNTAGGLAVDFTGVTNTGVQITGGATPGSTVPEPTTLWLVGAGAVAFALRGGWRPARFGRPGRRL